MKEKQNAKKSMVPIELNTSQCSVQCLQVFIFIMMRLNIFETDTLRRRFFYFSALRKFKQNIVDNVEVGLFGDWELSGKIK